ncbi:MAG: phosphoglycerate kinase [bacterium]|nr:phosphoglycerate kinase [bacterium]MDA1024712.1 phosphoglycerate kinase [bacterium]
MQLRRYTKRLVRGKRLIMRIDSDVSVANGKVDEASALRLKRVLPELESLLSSGARITLLGHLGRPDGKVQEEYSLKPVQRYLASNLGRRVQLIHQLNTEWHKWLETGQGGEVALVENLRFFKGEKENDAMFAAKLAEGHDLFLQNAAANIHRSHASMDRLPSMMQGYAGNTLIDEVHRCELALRHPSAAMIGGMKLTSKQRSIEGLASNVDVIFPVGGLAVAFLSAKLGKQLTAGSKRMTKDDLALAASLLNRFRDQLQLPHSVMVVDKIGDPPEERFTQELRVKDRIVDIGADTIDSLITNLSEARSVIWNGPLGLVEEPAYAVGTERIARMLAAEHRSTALIGGGDTTRHLTRMGLASAFTHFSTAGGAMLAFLAGDPLPGLESIKA